MTTTTPLPADHQNRLAALDPLRSVCVTAPAGSGKTELLSQRVLRLLARVEQPEEILAITFTRKAAGEMHHRIMEALVAANAQPRPEQPHKQLSWQLAHDALAQDRKQNWRLLENPSRLKVQTIDSLCASLTRQMPVLSNFGAQPQITDQAERYYQLAIEQFLGHLEDNSVPGEALAILLTHLDNDVGRLQRLLIDLLQRRDQWLLHLGIGDALFDARTSLQRTLQRIVADGLAVIAERLQPWAAELLPLLDYAGCRLRAAHSDSSIVLLAGITALPPVAVDCRQHWQGIAELLLTQKLQFRSKLDKNCGFPTETEQGDKPLAKRRKEQMNELLAQMREDSALLTALAEFFALPATTYPDSQWQLLESLLRLLPTLVAELNVVFQQHGCVDYTEISLAALHSLGETLEPSALALKLDYRLRHILIDEFQDTSTTQYRLLQRLTDDWAEHNAANPDNPNTLFLVGDGMQSIYGFREANVGLFLEARKFGVNGMVLDDLPLSVNFRSAPAVVSWNNHVFTQAFPAEENLARGAVPYEPAIAFNHSDDRAEVAVFGFADNAAEQREAAYLVDRISVLMAEKADESIAVLVRSRGHLQAIITELTRRGMAWNATDIDSLNSYACVLDLLTLTKAMLNFADRVSWTALLRTPWFGLDNVDLFHLLSRSDKQSAYRLLLSWPELGNRLSVFGRERLSRQLPKITAALASRQRFSDRVWIEGLWLALGGAAALRDAREFEMVDSFFDLLEQHQIGGQVESLALFEQALQRLYARPQNNNGNLHLMTIHKSKGLEFDTVIVPGLARSPRSDDRSLLMWREYLSPQGDFSGLVVSPMPASGEEDKTYDYLRHEQTRTQILENTRLLYVAATRAVKRLYLSFCAETDEKQQQPKPPRRDSLLASLWPAISTQVQWQVPDAVEKGQLGLNFETVDSPLQLRRLSATWRPPQWQFPNPLSGFYLNADYDGDNTHREAQDIFAVAVGNVVHRIFEVLHQRGTEYWRNKTTDERIHWLRALLGTQELDIEQYEAAIAQIQQSVENTLADSKGRWLLNRGSAYDFAELSVASLVEGRVRQRVIDRVLCDADGTLWIVDYKTAQPGEDESLDVFFQRECECYRPQLLDYRWYISRLLEYSGPIRLALYFTAVPRLREIAD